MIRLLKCEYKKTRRRYIFLTAVIMTVLLLVWALYGNYSGDNGNFIMQNGWLMFLYQLPLTNAIFFPLLAIIIASRLADIEHKGNNFKIICTITEKKKLYDAKLLYGIGIMVFSVIMFWTVTVIFGRLIGFAGEIPIKLYLLYLLFILTPTIAVYIFQHSLSMIFKNQAIAFFIGILGEFVGVFSMFLPSLPYLRRSVLWGYYGVLQFVGMFGWSKETRYENVYFEIMDIDWKSFLILTAAAVVIYLIGRRIFCEREV